jgi:hypothetical protein
MSSPPVPLLPVELCHEIISNLCDDLAALKQCALVCATLRYIVQQHLFADIALYRFPASLPDRGVHEKRSNVNPETRCSWLLEPAHSHLLSHIRHLRLQCFPPPGHSKPDLSFISVLEQIPAHNLKKITILRRYRDNPLSDTENIIRALLRCSTALEELNLEDRVVLASHLISCSPYVRTLRVHGTEFVEDEAGLVDSWPKLKSLIFPQRLLPECLLWMIMGRMGERHSVFPLLKLLFVGDESKEVEVVNEVLDMCKPSLRSFVYTPYCYSKPHAPTLDYKPNRPCSLGFSSYPNHCYNQNGNVIEFTTPPTLRSLAIRCPVMLKPASGTYPNPFGWLIHTFHQLSRRSCSLEEVHIKFLTTLQIERLDALFPGGFPIDLCFHEFDRLLSDETRFPALKKVYLTVGRHYLNLFADPRTLPILNGRGLLGIIYEEISTKQFWAYNTRTLVRNLPWNGWTYSSL